MYSNNDIFIKNEGDGRKQGVVRAIMNGWDDTSAHYDLSSVWDPTWNGTEVKRNSPYKKRCGGITNW